MGNLKKDGGNHMKTIKVNDIILNSKFNRFHLQILLACIFIIVVDGYDMFMLGAILPPLMEEWNIPPVSAGVLSSYALVGIDDRCIEFSDLLLIKLVEKRLF